VPAFSSAFGVYMGRRLGAGSYPNSK